MSDALAKWAPLVLMFFGISAYIIKAFLFVRAGGEKEAASISDLKSTLLAALTSVQNDVKNEREMVMYRLAQVEIGLRDLGRSDADRTSRIVAVDTHDKRIESLEDESKSLRDRIAACEAKHNR